MKTLEEIELELDKLQESYLDEEDELKQIEIDFKFSRLLEEATELDGELRLAAGVTIHNWTKN